MGEVRTMITPIYGNEWPVEFEGTYIDSNILSILCFKNTLLYLFLFVFYKKLNFFIFFIFN